MVRTVLTRNAVSFLGVFNRIALFARLKYRIKLNLSSASNNS